MHRASRTAGLVAAGCAVTFGLLAVLVATGATRGPDSSVLARLRPADAWGEAQVRFSPWLYRLEPQRTLTLLALTCCVVAVLRRSWRPILTGGVVGATTVVLTVLVKLLLRRADPHGFVAASGGSFPSGHMAATVAALAGCVLVAWPRGPWWRWAPVVAAAGILGTAQLVAAAHWPSDLLGGALLAVAVLALVVRLGPAPAPRVGAAPARLVGRAPVDASGHADPLGEEVDEHRGARRR